MKPQLLKIADHAAVHLADGAAPVARDVEVEREPERVVGELGGAGDEARVVAAGVLARVDLVGQAPGLDLLSAARSCGKIALLQVTLPRIGTVSVVMCEAAQAGSGAIRPPPSTV